VADEFGTAIYTNCPPGQGLEGIGGMQFQSHSPGIDRKVLALIRRHLIYEPPERLIRERQPIEAFPPSFAHVHEDGAYATAAGVYVGREAVGNRPGNHLTQAIATGNPRAYRSVRPAQLFGAPFWRMKPAATTHSDPLDASWRPGPLNAAEASRFVNAQPDGVAMLAALLAALAAHLKRDGETDARRVLFIAEHPEAVLHWLTAATLLLSQQDALRIGFKVFTNDPARSTLPVVAVNPDWARSAATVEQDRGYVVFDLIRHLWTDVAQPQGVQQWARLFCEADPRDVSEAVELAATSGLNDAASRELAVAAVLGHMPSVLNADALVHWLKTGPPALREAYGGRLVDTLARLQNLSLLRQVDKVAHDQFPGRRDDVRLALLRLELERALSASSSRRWRPMTTAAERTLSTTAEPEAQRLVAESLRRANGPAFDAVLRASAGFGVSVPLDAVREPAITFVAKWADSPEAGYDPSAWPQDPPLYDMLRDELSGRIIAQERERWPAAVEMIADGWWNRLWRWTPERADITSPLDRALLSAAMLHSDPPSRLNIVRANLGRTPDPAALFPYRQWVDALWARRSATTDELRTLCEAVPGDTELNPALFRDLVARANSDPVAVPELELCGDLADKHLLALDAQTDNLVAQHRWLQALEAHLSGMSSVPEVIDHLPRIQPGLLTAHAQQLARGLVMIDDALRITHLLDGLPPEVVIAYLHELRADGLSPFRSARVAVMFAVYQRPDEWWTAVNLGDDLRHVLDEAIQKWCRTALKKDVRDVASRVGPLGTAAEAAWNDYVGKARRRRFLPHLDTPGR
jgi:hypothetical protein